MTNEITSAVDLCTSSGRLNPAAIGWSRHPLHRCNLRGHYGRKKRWDYWCVTCDTHALSITYADFDYLGIASAFLLDFETLSCIEASVSMPLAFGFAQPDTVGGADIAFDRSGLRFAFKEEPGGTRIQVAFEDIEADVLATRPEGHETLNVVVPFGGERFQFTSKQNTLPATGRIRAGDRTIELGPSNTAFACLDYGRGVWPYRRTWNWASASGHAAGHTVGLQFGGKWTDDTGQTENGLCIDGRLTKFHDDFEFNYDRADFMKPWQIRSPGPEVDLAFTPLFEKTLKVETLVVGTELHLCFGRFKGEVTTEAGERIEIPDLIGWSEEMRAHW